MTVEAQNPDGTPIVKSGPYNGNGVTTAFNYTFPITAIGEVKVVRQNADLTETVLVLTTDYTVTGAGNPAGGQVNLNSGALLPTGAKLALLLDMDFDQAVDYSNQGRIQLSLLEISLDKLTLAARQLREELLRAVTVDAFGTVDIAQLRTNINALAAIEAQIITVSSNIASVQTVAGISANVTAVAGIAANVTTVADNIAAINTNSANIVAIQDAATNAANAATSATNAANSASAAATSATNAANSATSAQGSATAAATSEANAANSAAQAATSAASMVVATQPQAEAATDNVAYMSSLRTKQQIDARLATQAEAETGTDNTKLMTPLRAEQHMMANALGWGQTWQNVGASRATNTSYQNTSGRPIMVAVDHYASSVVAGNGVQVSSNGSTWLQLHFMTGGSARVGTQFVVPNNWYYRLFTTGSSGFVNDTWLELR